MGLHVFNQVTSCLGHIHVAKDPPLSGIIDEKLFFF